MSDNNQLFGMFVGIVVQNNDPEKRGRVKVWVPQHGPAIDAENKILKEATELSFKFFGENCSPEVTGMLEQLKLMLPWAEYAGPLFGGNSSGRYNAATNIGTPSDSNFWLVSKLANGFRPANLFTEENAPGDAFSETKLHGNRMVNQYTNQYQPANYSGMARGSFSIPNVGAHLYVFYLEGNPMFPVYFAAAYGTSDIRRIYTGNESDKSHSSQNYPAGYENDPSGLNEETKTFRAKSVLNSNKHTIEFIDTDHAEKLNLVHYSGSYKSFGNDVTVELATRNDQRLVMGNQFSTINGQQSEYIGQDAETIYAGDRFETVGETKRDVVDSIVELHRELHDYKRLFPLRRAMYGETIKFGEESTVISDCSVMQRREPEVGVGFAPCPVCQGLKYNPFDTSAYGDEDATWKETRSPIGDCTGLFQEYTYTFSPTATSGATSGYNEFTNMVGYYAGALCPCCGNLNYNGTKIPGYSPATESGMWKKEPVLPITYKIAEYANKILENEKLLGPGGDEIVKVAMSKIETIGLVMNDLASFRTDPIGKSKIDGMYVSPQKTFPYFQPAPHVEYVDVADIPGGDYIVTAMNRYKLTAGSRGISLQTTGPLDTYGTIVNMASEQMNISSKNETVLDGGERLTIRARKVTINPVEHNALTIDGQLHVTRNTILGGGAMIEGELGVNHITAPVEWHTTEYGRWEFDPLCTVSALIDEVPVALTLPHHTHTFQSIPISFKKHKNGVRAAMLMLGINDRMSVMSSGIIDDTVWEACEDDSIYEANEEAIYGNCDNGFIAAKSNTTVVGAFLLDPVLGRIAEKIPGGCGGFAVFVGSYCKGNQFSLLFETVTADEETKYSGSEYIVANGTVKEDGSTEIVGVINCRTISAAEAKSAYGYGNGGGEDKRPRRKF